MAIETPNTTKSDPSHDIFMDSRQSLEAIFNPTNVAVIGATENANAVGRTILWNLVSNPFGGTVFPVNPKRPSVLGIKAYPSIKEVPAKVDLAVIIIPATAVPGTIAQCVECGVRSAIIISAGFKEIGPAGAELERQVLAEARKGGMRIIGPNCLGVANPITGLNATFAKGMPRPGHLAFISQSGALLTAVLDWSFRQQVGFSSFVSVGSMLDVGWGDLIDYLGNDPRTHCIVIYMETVGDARAFLSAAREVALNKPIIVIKPGRTEAASKAAASHTGSLTGSDDVLDAAFKRVGVLRVQHIAELFNMADVLAKQPRPRGPRLTIITNAGGPGVLATDALVEGGGQLTQLTPKSIEELNPFLPAAWSHANPIDIIGDAPPERYARTLEIIARDENADGMLVILTPQDMTDATQTAEHLKQYAHIEGKPVLASWMGGPDIAAGEAILNRAGIPTFPEPDAAAKAFTYMWKFTENLRSLYETPTTADSAVEGQASAEAAEAILKQVRAQQRTILTEFESKKLLAAYGIPTVETHVATEEKQAVDLATKLGFPVVLKLHSLTVTHKTDVGGVKLGLCDAAAVKKAFAEIKAGVTAKAGAQHFQGVTVQPMVKLKDAYEVIIGSSIDRQFGPVLLFGSGGQLVEVYKDRALGLPPLNATLARRMMEQTAIYRALKGVRGRKPVDLDELERILVRFSQLVVEHRWISEIDINPLLASEQGIIALDARVVLFDAATPEDKLPRPAIRPYPRQYVKPWTTRDGKTLTLRPIRPEDEPMMVLFHQTLSERSVRMRYFQPLKLSQRVTHERLIRVCFNDYDRELALVAHHTDSATGMQEIVGVGRLSKVHGTNGAEFAIVINDNWQNKGLGTELLTMLVRIARDEGLARVTANILPENIEMQRVCEKVGFKLKRMMDEPLVKAEIDIRTR